MLPPFMVFNGKTGATLDRKYADWCSRPGHFASVNFQRKHWFDAVITLRWIKWMLKQFPPHLIMGLIWDKAPGYESREVVHYLKQQQNVNRLYSSLIPGGLTSILQIADVVIKSPQKCFIKHRYFAWTN